MYFVHVLFKMCNDDDQRPALRRLTGAFARSRLMLIVLCNRLT